MFSGKQITAMVVAVSAAVVLAPVGVMAATGQLVALTDPVLDRKVRVGSGGTLQVESRAGATSGAFNQWVSAENTAMELQSIVGVTGPTRIALTEVTLSGDTPTASGHDKRAIVSLVSVVHKYGVKSCHNIVDGFGDWHNPVFLRTWTFPITGSMQMQFNGPPLIIQPAPSGKSQCVGFRIGTVQNSAWRDSAARLYLGATGFTYT